MMDLDPILIICLALITCAFFSGLEIAFLTANKFKIELERKQGVISAKIFSNFIKEPSRFITTILLGNSISIVVYGMYAEDFLEPYIAGFTASEPLIFFLKIVFSTIFILLTAEYIPKSLFSVNPNRILSIFAIPFIIIYYLLFPLVWVTMTLSEFVINRFSKGGGHHGKLTFGKVDLENYLETINQVGGENENDVEHEVKIFQNALSFSEVKARDCMVPRAEITAIDVESNIEELKHKFIETGFSKLIVYKDTTDNVIGYVHSSELFKYPESIKYLLLPVLIVPESKPANEVLTTLIQQRKSLAIVVDEFGGTAGMITMEDIIEKIFGDIEDEHDDEAPAEREISPNEYVFASRLEIDYLNNKYNLNLPESEEYETLAGLILHHAQSIPEKNQVIKFDVFTFSILNVSKKRIELVKLEITK